MKLVIVMEGLPKTIPLIYNLSIMFEFFMMILLQPLKGDGCFGGPLEGAGSLYDLKKWQGLAAEPGDEAPESRHASREALQIGRAHV